MLAVSGFCFVCLSPLYFWSKRRMSGSYGCSFRWKWQQSVQWLYLCGYNSVDFSWHFVWALTHCASSVSSEIPLLVNCTQWINLGKRCCCPMGQVWRAFHYLLSKTGTKNELRNCIKRRECVRQQRSIQSCVLPALLSKAVYRGQSVNVSDFYKPPWNLKAYLPVLILVFVLSFAHLVIF